MKYKQVEEYLRNYSMDEPPYDSNGAIHLLKAIIGNLQNNLTVGDLEDYSSCLDEYNETFLKQLIEYIPISRKLNEEQD
jgi:hypothetical protein